MRSPKSLRAWWSLGCLVLVQAVSTPASAQAAADKATARQLALAGTDAYDAGRYAEALDKLTRAQTLFEAPIHLLYIARSQAKLKRLVEAAETYRKLALVEIAADGPGAFLKAQADGKVELAELLPRIPSIKIHVAPQDVEGMVLSINSVPVSSAVIGVDRPANPGTLEIEVSAPGYASQTHQQQLAEGEHRELSLTLEEDGTPKSSSGPGPKGLYLGVRLGGAVPVGDIGKHPASGNSIPISDQFGPGGGGELRAGYRFASLFTPHLYLEGYGLSAGNLFNESVTVPGTEVTTTTLQTGAGIGLSVGTPQDKLGGFAEVGLGFHRMAAALAVSEGGRTCDNTLTYSGTALRMGGGMHVPLTPTLRLEPYVDFTLSQFDQVEREADERCAVPTVVGGDPGLSAAEIGVLPGFGSQLRGSDSHKLEDDEKALHVVFSVGVGIAFSQL